MRIGFCRAILITWLFQWIKNGLNQGCLKKKGRKKEKEKVLKFVYWMFNVFSFKLPNFTDTFSSPMISFTYLVYCIFFLQWNEFTDLVKCLKIMFIALVLNLSTLLCFVLNVQLSIYFRLSYLKMVIFNVTWEHTHTFKNRYVSMTDV